MRVTMKDVAEAAGVSLTTVSLVVNNKANNIPEKTRKRVLDVAKQLNFRPNQLAVGLATSRSKTIGLIVPDIRNEFFATMAKVVEEAARMRGWHTFLSNTNNEHLTEKESIQALIDNNVDGIIYNMAVNTDIDRAIEVCRLMEESGISYVMTDRNYEQIDCSVVSVNHRMGGYLATKYLLESGHTRIACITGPQHLEDSMQRLEGYQRALKEYNVPFCKNLIYEGTYISQSGYEGARKILKSEPGVTAIFAFNDLSAVGVLKYLTGQNISVPKDLSIVGYDDTDIAGLISPTLTSVRQPLEEIGRLAVEMLAQQIENGSNIRQKIFLEPELIIRDSTQKAEESQRRNDNVNTA